MSRLQAFLQRDAAFFSQPASPSPSPKLSRLLERDAGFFSTEPPRPSIETYPQDARGAFHAEDPPTAPYRPLRLGKGEKPLWVSDRTIAENQDDATPERIAAASDTEGQFINLDPASAADFNFAQEQHNRMLSAEARMPLESHIPYASQVTAPLVGSIYDIDANIARGLDKVGLGGVIGVDDEVLNNMALTGNEMEAAADDIAGGSKIMRFVRGGLRSGTTSLIGGRLGGPYGAIALQTAIQANQSYAEAKHRGLSEEEAKAYAAKMGGAEGAIATTFQLFGLGGLERAWAKEGVKQPFRQAFKKALKQYGIRAAFEEAPEELFTRVVQNAVDDQHKFQSLPETNPDGSYWNEKDGFSPRVQSYFDALGQAFVSTGMSDSVHFLADNPNGLEAWIRKNPDRAKIVAAIEDPTRKALEDAGLTDVSGVDKDGRPLTTKEERTKFVGNVRAALQREYQQPDDVEHYPPNVLGIDESGEPIFGPRAVKNAPTTPKMRGEVPDPAAKPFSLAHNPVTKYSPITPGDIVAFNGMPATVKRRSENGNKFDIFTADAHYENVDRRDLDGWQRVPKRGEPLPDGTPNDAQAPAAMQPRYEPPQNADNPRLQPTIENRPATVIQPEQAQAAPPFAAVASVDRAKLQAELPGQTLVDLPDGNGWRVELQNGRWFTVRNVADVGPVNREAAERTAGRKLTDEEFSRFQPRGQWRISTKEGQEFDGEGLMKLVNGKADNKTARHELLHAARSLGLLTDGEWKALVGKHAYPSLAKDRATAERMLGRKLTDQEFAHIKTDGWAEEQIARGYESWHGPKGLWAKLTAAINRLLSALGVVNPTADTAFARLQGGGVWGRDAKPETSTEAKARLSGDVRYSGEFETAPKISIKQFDGNQGHKTLRERVKAWWRANLAGKTFTNRDTGKKIVVSGPAIEKAASHLPDAKPLAAVEALPRLLEIAKYVRSEPPRVPDQNVRNFHIFTAPLSIDGTPHTTTLKVREVPDGNYFYDQHIVEAQKSGPPFGGAHESEDSRYPSGGPQQLNIDRDGRKVKPDEGNSLYSGDVANYGEQDTTRYKGDVERSQSTAQPYTQFANPGDTPESRRVVDDARRDMPENKHRDVKAMQAEIDRELAADRDGARQRLIASIESANAAGGYNITGRDVLLAKKIISTDGWDALANGDPGKLNSVSRLTEEYTRQRSEQGFALWAGKSPSQTPTEYAKQIVFDALFEMPPETKKKINQATREKAKELRSSWFQFVGEFKAKMERSGVLPSSPEGYADLLRNPFRANQVANELRARKNLHRGIPGWMDFIKEWQRTALMGGFKTFTANLSAYPNYLGHTLAKAAEASFNTVVGRKDGAQLGELAYMFRGMAPGLSFGLRNAIDSFRYDQPMFEQRTSGGLGTDQGSEAQGGRHALPGTLGRAARAVGYGPTRAADELMTTHIAHMEVFAQAYRIAKQESLSGEQLERRIGELVADTQSPAWDAAKEIANRMGFREAGGDVRAQVKKIGHAIAGVNIGGVQPLSLVIPFINTPVSIFAHAIEWTPLNAVMIGYEGVKNVREGRAWHLSKDADGKIRDLGPDVAKAVLGSLAIYALLDQVEDGEEEKGSFAITGSDHPKHPNSVRIGGNYYSYARMPEPFSTSLGTIANAAIRWRRGDSVPKAVVVSIGDQFKNKTWTQGIGNLVRGFEQWSSADPDESSAAMDYVVDSLKLSFVPKVFTQWLPATREFQGETKTWGATTDPEQYADRRQRRMLERLGIGLAESADRFDIWGRRKSLRTWESPTGDFFYRLGIPLEVSKAEAHPGDVLIARYNATLPSGAARFEPPQLNPTFTRNGKAVSMTDEQFARYAEISGKLSDKLFRMQRFDPLKPSPDQIRAIKNNITAARSFAKEILKRELASGKPESLTSALVDKWAKQLLSARIRLAAEKLQEAPKPRSPHELLADYRLRIQTFKNERAEKLAEYRRIVSNKRSEPAYGAQ